MPTLSPVKEVKKINHTFNVGVDILENKITEKYPEVLEILLFDNTSQRNIIWGTNNYEDLGKEYHHDAHILTELITGKNGSLIMPRVEKAKVLQQGRAKNMAEVFTPSWVCNLQNNLIDNSWFGQDNTFNTESKIKNQTLGWKTNKNKITFPKNKNWKDYVQDKRLEIACGEAPYITSRYDTTTGEFIPVENRIGLLDRKLRIINENTKEPIEWLNASQDAFKSTYAYEWQGDSLLLAREAMLFTFIENYTLKFNETPSSDSIKLIAKIISWNVWQMNGLTGVIPSSSIEDEKPITELTKHRKQESLFMEQSKSSKYCFIMDWEKEAKVRFIDLFNH